MARKLAFIGFGEAGQYMSEGLIREAGADVAVWDILFDDPGRGPAMRARAAEIGARVAASAADAMSGAAIADAVWAKQAGHGISSLGFVPPERTMSAIGG